MSRKLLNAAIPVKLGLLISLSLALAIAIPGCARSTTDGGRGSADSGAAESAPPGLLEDAAVQLAAKHVPAGAILTEAKSGAFGDIVDDHRLGPGYPVAADRMVWGITYESAFTLCPPDGSACWSPRPGWTTVVLDYFTGEFLAAPAIRQRTSSGSVTLVTATSDVWLKF